MKHLQIFEDYSQNTSGGQTTMDQFKSLRRGDKVKYMGDRYIVEEPGEYELILRSDDFDAKEIKVSYNMFKSKGMI
jgi:hypothetical protein